MSVTDLLPPSPPTTLSRKRTFGVFSEKPVTCTPEDSPASFQGSSGQASRKRVEFSPWTNVHDPAPSTTSLANISTIKPLPPSRECPSYSKSILKVNIEDEKVLSGKNEPIDLELSTSEKMESVIQQLSQNQRAASIDAYQTLATLIKLYDEIPEEVILRNKMGVLTKCVRRDLMALEKSEPEPMDTMLVTQALKIVVILVWSPDFSPCLTDEFRIFILDRSIQVITEHTAPKSVIIHYLHLLATQDFRPSLLTSKNRAHRLLEALKNLTDHVKGNGAVSERLLVYQKLIEQAKSVMKAKANCWINELLSGMISGIPDTRTKAITFGLKATSVFPTSPTISTATRSALETELDSGKTLGSAMCRKLEKMVSVKDVPTQAPQIWSIVLLLCNANDRKIDSWSQLRDWLKVIQRCFNSSDAAVRQQANTAWNRFIYVVRPHDTSEALASMLAKPIVAQMQSHESDKGRQASRLSAVSCYCNLLYYAFRPAASHKQYARSWNEYIVKIFRTSFFHDQTSNADIASRTLIALFGDSSAGTKLWNENRAHESSSVEPEELPTIDCKWVRANASAIIEIYRLLFSHSPWGPSGYSDQALVAKAWTGFVKALREASSKEIKTSNEMKTAVATVIQFLDSLWHEEDTNDQLLSSEDSRTAAKKTRFITRTAVAEIGPMAFLEAIESREISHPIPLLIEIFDVISLPISTSMASASVRPTALVQKVLPSTNTVLMDRALKTYNTILVATYMATDHLLYRQQAKALQSFSTVLPLFPKEKFLSSLHLISEALSMWLSDEGRVLDISTASKFDSTGVVGQLKIAHTQFLNTVFSTVSQMDSREMKSVSGILIAAFKSSHEVVVNTAIEAWKTTLAHGDLAQDSSLLATISSSCPQFDLDILRPSQIGFLECFLVPGDASNPESILETETASTEIQASDIVDKEIINAEGATRSSDKDQPENEFDLTESIQIVNDESNLPPFFIEEPSDILGVDTANPNQYPKTYINRLEGNRERQEFELALVFPDIRSSPRHSVKSVDLHGCEFARKAAQLHERPSTPTLPIQTDKHDIEDAPSPTPRSRHHVNKLTDTEVPSSPPSITDHPEKLTSSLDKALSPMQETFGDENVAIELDLSNDMTDGKEFDSELLILPDNTSNLAIGDEDLFKSQEPLLENQPCTSISGRDELTPSKLDLFALISTDRPPHDEDFGLSTSVLRTSSSENDEIDLMSASQLSNDLDLHISLAAGPSVTQGGIDTEERHQDQREVHEVNTNSLNKKRKRKSSGSRDRLPKKGLKLIHPQGSRDGNVNISSFFSKEKIQKDVDSEFSLEPIVSNEISIEEITNPSSPSCDQKGEGQKHPNNTNDTDVLFSLLSPTMPASKNPAIEESMDVSMADDVSVTSECFHTPQHKGRSFDEAVNRAVQQALATSSAHLQQATPEDDNFSTSFSTNKPDSVEQQVERSEDNSVAPQTPTQAAYAVKAQAPAKISIISSLRQVLEMLKKDGVDADGLDLRTIDELCFQIRFQAQVVSHR